MDDGFRKLLVWVDYNMDGVSTTTEVFPLSHFNINRIPLKTTEYQKVVNGSRVKQTVTTTTTNGKTMLFGDVDFRAGVYASPSIFTKTK